jgi:hypothetical protein
MYIIIQLREDVASELRNHLGNKNTVQLVDLEVQSLLNLVTKIGVRLEPVHQNTLNPLLVPFFMIAVTDRELSEKIISSLQQFTIVEAAYLKPDEQLP